MPLYSNRRLVNRCTQFSRLFKDNIVIISEMQRLKIELHVAVTAVTAVVVVIVVVMAAAVLYLVIEIKKGGKLILPGEN